jgi:hypothetical protein
MERLTYQQKLFVSRQDTVVDQVFSELSNASIKSIGPELIFGKIYDHIGYNAIKEELFRHLVVSRLAFPLTQIFMFTSYPKLASLFQSISF